MFSSFFLFFFSQLWTNRTNNFHHFVKLALTKNPKKRPTAEKLLQVSRKKQHSINTKETHDFSVVLSVIPYQNVISSQRNPLCLTTHLCLFACLPAPFCVSATQQNFGHRAAGQSQQPRPQHLQRLWWWRSWTGGNFWPSKNHTCQHRGDCIFTRFNFLPLKSHPSLFSLAHSPPFILLIFFPSDASLNLLHFLISFHPPLLVFFSVFVMPHSVHLAHFLFPFVNFIQSF